MNYTTSLLLLSILFLSSCLESAVEINDPTREFRIQRSMNLDSLKEGQLIRFAGFIIDDIFNEQPTARYSGDTLELEVVSVENGIIEIKESITRCSNFFFNEGLYPFIRESLQGTNTWQIQNDTLQPSDVIIEGIHCIARSVLIHTCDLPFTEATTEIDSMDETNIDLFFNSDICTEGYCDIRRFELLGRTYEDLKLKRDAEYTYSDGPGSITFYSRAHGIVRMMHYFGDFVQATGWDRIWDPIPLDLQEPCPQEKDAIED